MLGRKTFLIFAVYLANFLMSFVALYFVAHNMGVIAVGMIGFALSFVNLFSPIARLGFGITHTKKISEGKGLTEAIGTYFRIKNALILLFIAVVMVAIFVDSTLIGTTYTFETYSILLLIIGHVAAYQYSEIYLHTFRALKETAKQEIPIFFGGLAQSLMRITVAVLGLGMIMLAGAYFLGGLMVLISALFFFRDKPSGKYDPHLAREYFSFAKYATIPAILILFTTSVDKIMVNYFWDVTEVGYYVGAERIAFIFIPISLAVKQLLLPTYSELSSRGQMDRVRILLSRSERYLVMLAVPVSLVFILFSEQIVGLILGEQFMHGVPTFSILAAVAAIMLLNNSYNALVLGLGHPEYTAKMWITLSMVNICLNLVFIPEEILGIPMLGMGAQGSAVGTLIIMFIAIVCFQHYIWKNLGGRTTRHLMFPILSGSLTFLVFIMIDGLYGIPMSVSVGVLNIGWDFPLFIIYGLMFLMIYASVLFASGELTKKDIRFFVSVVDPAKMKRYIKSEIGGNRKTGRGRR